ncbi:MAG: hypothetical protein IJ740_18850 [Ruminococcus sp.]|jgi:hypothetical protein|nr:hypothetical protein [Ruminococcus sp.]MBR1752901.1 hypothetical protein [Ruminococcus sp.]
MTTQEAIYKLEKIAENTTITIDVEDLKRQAVRSFYEHIKGGLMFRG